MNVGGLVVSSHDITNQNAMGGNLAFTNPAAQATNGAITTSGKINITAGQAGLAALVAPSVINNGTIKAYLGKIALASGDKWTLDLYGDHLVNFVVSDKVANNINVENYGTIAAEGGSVQISANMAATAYSDIVNYGVISADTATTDVNGTVYLVAGNISVDGGTTSGFVNYGYISASMAGQNSLGGHIMLARLTDVFNAGDASILASGSGGEIDILDNPKIAEGSLYNEGFIDANGGSYGGTIKINGFNLENTLSIDVEGSQHGGKVSFANGNLDNAVGYIDADSSGYGGTIVLSNLQGTSSFGALDVTGGIENGKLIIKN